MKVQKMSNDPKNDFDHTDSFQYFIVCWYLFHYTLEELKDDEEFNIALYEMAKDNNRIYKKFSS